MQLRKKIDVTSSKFAMWRTAVGLAYSDHELTQDEVALLHDAWQNYDFSDEQRAQLEQDLELGVDVKTVFAQITEPQDRAHLINFSYQLFHIDGGFSALEAKISDVLQSRHKDTIDMRAVRAEMSASASGYERLEQSRIQSEKGSQKWFENAFEYLTGIDL